jgi:hypothetical protein
MSTEESEEGGVLRTVTPSYLGRPDREMDVFGWGMFLTLAIILVPLLPFLVIGWVISKLLDIVDPR